jgi:hypothetical protein
MYRTIHESVTFSQEIQEGSSVATTTIAIKSYTNAIDDITNAYVSFLRALDFMDCQIIEELEDQLDNLKERRTFELSQVEEDTTTEDDDDDDDQPPTFSENKEVTFSRDGIDMKYSFDNVYCPSKDAITFG